MQIPFVMLDLNSSIPCSNYIENSSPMERKQGEGFDMQKIIEMALQNYGVTNVTFLLYHAAS